MRLSYAAFLGAALVLPLSSQAGWTGFAGYVHDEHHGGELALGYEHFFLTNTSITLNPAQIMIYAGEKDGRYREQTLSNGNTVCRDTRNGQFAKDEKCDPPIKVAYTPSATIDHQVTQDLSLGVGFRVGEKKDGAFGRARFRVGESWFLGVQGGSHYFGISAGLPFARR